MTLFALVRLVLLFIWYAYIALYVEDKTNKN